MEQIFNHVNSKLIRQDERDIPPSSLLEGSLPCSQNPATVSSHEQLRASFKPPKSVSTRSTSTSKTLATLSPDLHWVVNGSRPGHAIPILTEVLRNVSYTKPGTRFTYTD